MPGIRLTIFVITYLLRRYPGHPGINGELFAAERAEARGETISLLGYARVGIPATVLTLVRWIASLAVTRDSGGRSVGPCAGSPWPQWRGAVARRVQ